MTRILKERACHYFQASLNLKQLKAVISKEDWMKSNYFDDNHAHSRMLKCLRTPSVRWAWLKWIRDPGRLPSCMF